MNRTLLSFDDAASHDNRFDDAVVGGDASASSIMTVNGTPNAGAEYVAPFGVVAEVDVVFSAPVVGADGVGLLPDLSELPHAPTSKTSATSMTTFVDLTFSPVPVASSAPATVDK